MIKKVQNVGLALLLAPFLLCSCGKTETAPVNEGIFSQTMRYELLDDFSGFHKDKENVTLTLGVDGVARFDWVDVASQGKRFFVLSYEIQLEQWTGIGCYFTEPLDVLVFHQDSISPAYWPMGNSTLYYWSCGKYDSLTEGNTNGSDEPGNTSYVHYRCVKE